MIVEKNENYEIDLNKESLRIYSKKQFQFQPEGWLKDLQKKTAYYLSKLEPKENALLQAFMESNFQGDYDTENVLLYNLGMKNLKSLMKNGVDLARIRTKDCLPFDFSAVYSLQTVDKLSKFEGEKIAAFKGIAFKSANLSQYKVSNIWYEFKSQLKEKATFYNTEDQKAPLGLELSINGEVQLEKLIKPLIDAIMSAFCTSNINQDLIKTISDQTKYSELCIKKLLSDKETSPLGLHKNLVHSWKDTIQWNPPDDVLDKIRILINSNNTDQVLLDGTLYMLIPKK